MFTKDSRKGTVRISFKPMYPVSTCEVAGDFNNWKPVEMPKDKTGQFVTDLPLAAGTHQYKFILDGQWLADPDNNTYVANAYGTINSVIQIEEQKKQAQAQAAAQASVQAPAPPPVQAKSKTTRRFGR